MKNKIRNLLLLDLINTLYLLLSVWLCSSLSFLLVEKIVNPSGKIVTFMFAFLFSYILFTIIVYRALPKLDEGKHHLTSLQAVSWVLKFYVKKTLWLPVIRELWGTFHYIQYIILKGFGCEIDYTFQIAANCFLCDPELMTFGKNVSFGGFVTTTSHAMIGNNVILKKIILEDNVSIGAESKIGSGVILKKNVKTGQIVHIFQNTEIGESSVLLNGCIIGSNVKIGKNVRIGENAYVKSGTTIPDDSVIDSGAVVG